MNLYPVKKREFLGKGAFVEVYKILELKEENNISYLKNGKVIKQFMFPLFEDDAKKLKKLLKKFILFNKKAGVKIIDTKIFISNSMKNNKVYFFMIQPFVPKKFFVENYLKTSSKKEKQKIYLEIVSLIKKVNKFNKGNEIIIGTNFSPQNMALINGKLTLIDIFPPYIKNVNDVNGPNSITPSDLVNYKRELHVRILKYIIKEKIIEDHALRFEARFDAKESIKRVKKAFEKI